MQGFFGRAQISECQFGVDDFDVGDGVDFARNVNHIVIIKTAHNVCNGVGLADVGEELIAQAFTFRGACDQTRNVDEFDGGGLHALWIDDCGQSIHAWVWDFNHAHIGLDGAEWVVFRCDACFG